MILWKDILKPITAVVGHDYSIKSAIQKITSERTDIAFVEKQGALIGYITNSHLLEQIGAGQSLDEPIQYKEDILKVPDSLPVEFFHNVTTVIGVDSSGGVTGYSTVKNARHQINELQLIHLNEIIHGAGVGIIRTNSQFKIEFMNETAERFLGLPGSFLLSRNYKALLTMEKDLQRVLDGETLVSVNSTINFKQMSGNFYPLKIDGNITGLVHMFYLREEFEEAVQELDFVRHLYSDLQAVYDSSNEQILVIDEKGTILRVAGQFLSSFWKTKEADQIIGKQIEDFTRRNIFQPNIFELCVKQGKKVTSIQQSSGKTRIWSVATPVYHEGKLEKVVILSRDITSTAPINAETELNPELFETETEKKQLVYRSGKIASLLNNLRRAAKMNSTILLEGESGVGKEIFAHEIHFASQRKDCPFIRVNCGAIPEQLIESELFGYEKGAFTGADRRGKAGLFERAHTGTIFLDEIGDLPLNMQVKLLRVIQEREMARIGGTETIPIDVRIIAATNKDLKAMVAKGDFREDLFYRLNVIPFCIPPLRERKEDIFPLAVYFLEEFKRTYNIEKSFTPDAISVLEMYGWPGNIRELENIVERLIVLSQEEWIDREVVLKVLYGEEEAKKKQPLVLEMMPLKEAVAELETQLIELGMRKYGTAAKVSEILGVSPATISRRMKKIKK
ncbi:sigma 54-interacting transcriptional regulator [Siminovitchia fortis]|uniref:HTH-type transcriptional regulatory protein TyrR n=1 Tax=Siminovitchia fortis TaxID=254758 RepID=A0A443IV20_9BACI|nr:sigma 54-interacting transcriptional regulator [Siminovitchia fortis]RWR11958.1 PAS domain-containing protein [Siminovitchia fortis]WHY80780.1 sigma 54-interacting transcriptional regulator [Siminovitchia fortis]